MNLNACEGCLSVNRSLKIVDENERKLFYSFINTNYSKNQMELCWECRALLKKFLRFKFQVQQARDVLDSYVVHHTILNSLSSLQTTQCKYEIVCSVECTQDTSLLASVKIENDKEVIQEITAENLFDDNGDDEEALINASHSLHAEIDLKITRDNDTIGNENNTENISGCLGDESLQAFEVEKRKSKAKRSMSSNGDDESDIDRATSVVNETDTTFKQNQHVYHTELKSLSNLETTEYENGVVCSVLCEERENTLLKLLKFEDDKDFVEVFIAEDTFNGGDSDKDLMENASHSLNTETDLKMDTIENDPIDNDPIGNDPIGNDPIGIKNNNEDLFDNSDDEPLNIIKEEKRASKAKRRVIKDLKKATQTATTPHAALPKESGERSSRAGGQSRRPPHAQGAAPRLINVAANEHVIKLSKPQNYQENNTGSNSTSSGNNHTPKGRIIEDIKVYSTKGVGFSTPKVINWIASSQSHDSSLPLLNNVSSILGDQSNLSFSRPSEKINSSENLLTKLKLNNHDKKISLFKSFRDSSSSNVNEKNNISNLYVEEIIHSGSDKNDSSYNPSESSQKNVQEKSFKKSSASETFTSGNTSSIDIKKLLVPSTTPNLEHPAVKKTKRHFCPFCKKLRTRFSSHLLLKHADEDDVMKFSHLSKRSKLRTKILASIRKRGDFLHNTLPEFNTGILIVPRQRKSGSVNSAEDYIACKNCKLFLSKTSFRLHIPLCDKSHQKYGRKLAGYIHPCASETLRRTIFPVFKDDAILRCIKYDRTIIKFGNKLCEKYTLTHQHDHIRAQLRLLGRLKREMMVLDKTINELISVFDPKQFDNLIKSIKVLASWNEQIMCYDHPSVAQNLITLIKKCAKELRVECIKSKDNNRKALVESFLWLWEVEMLTQEALEDPIAQKRQKKAILPSKSDIKLLFDYLQEQCFICLEILSNKFQNNAWVLLTQSTLISVQIFNKRCAREIERLTLIDYENKTSLSENLDPEIYNKLSKNAREYAAQYKRLTIRGERGRTVPVLLSPFVVHCIDVIIKYRKEAKILSSNGYIFSKPNRRKLCKQYFRACPLMRRFANDCGALIPSALRGTTLRKHITTYTIMLNIEQSQVDRLANFMGNNKDIYKSIYRMSVPVAEITDVSRLLMAAIGDDDEEGNKASDEENSDSSDDDMSGNDDSDSHEKSVRYYKRKASHTPTSKNSETYKRKKTEVADHSNESDESSGRKNQTNDNRSQSNERIPPPVAASPVAQKEDRPGDLVPIGSGRTLVHKDKYKLVNWQSYKTATRSLLRALFSRTVLSTHCLSGKPSSAYPDRPAKMCLDKQKVTDIVIEVRERFGVEEDVIRKSITEKCSTESAMWKKRQMRQKENE